MGNAYHSFKKTISNNKHSTNQKVNKLGRMAKMYIVCQYWKESMKLDGLILSLIDIIVKYAYTKYDPKDHPYHVYDPSYRLTLVGPKSSGKSSILLKYLEYHFWDRHIATIGVDFKIKTIECEYKRLMLQILDTAGQGISRQITHKYYKRVAGIFIVFDITNRRSFECLSGRFTLDVSKHANLNTVLMLVGTKCDLAKDRKVSIKEAKKFAKSSGCVQYIEVSAKHGTNIEYCVKQMMKRIREKEKNRLNRPFLYPCTEQI